MRGPDPQTLLIRALTDQVGGLCLDAASSDAWSSATFSGARHTLRFALDGEDAMAVADRMVATLDEREFDLPGHLVADIAATRRDWCNGKLELTIEALTVEDC